MATPLSYAMSLDTHFSGLRRLPSRSNAVNQAKGQPNRKLTVVKVEASNVYRPGSTIGPIQDRFLPFLAEAARSDEGRAQLADHRRGLVDEPPLLNIAAAKMAQWQMTAPPAQEERAGGSSNYGEHRPRRPPPDLPSLLLNSRIVYVGMPVSDARRTGMREWKGRSTHPTITF